MINRITIFLFKDNFSILADKTNSDSKSYLYDYFSHDLDRLKKFFNENKFLKYISIVSDSDLLLNFFHQEIDNFTRSENLNMPIELSNLFYPSNQKCNSKTSTSGFTNIQCPNLQDKSIVAYYPKKGFTFCTGPLARTPQNDKDFYFCKDPSSIYTEILASALDNASKKLLTKFTIDTCENCMLNFSNFTSNELLFFINNNPWKNVLRSFNTNKLDSYNLIFNPKFIKSAPVNSIVNPYKKNKRTDRLTVISGDHLSESLTNQFTNFIYESFYKVHAAYYTENDFKKFKKELGTFLQMPHKFIFHYLDDTLIATIAVCFLEKHPFFNQKACHIGYWGISQQLTSKVDRDTIKNSWGEFLKNLNADYIITANIDYFNKAALHLVDNFHFEGEFLRLDPRC